MVIRKTKYRRTAKQRFFIVLSLYLQAFEYLFEAVTFGYIRFDIWSKTFEIDGSLKKKSKL